MVKKGVQNKSMVSTALLGLLLSASSIGVENVHAGQKGKVKCKGVAVKWGNDCGVRGGHGCSGKAKTNFDSKEWVYLTKADCDAVTQALKNPAVRSYVESVRNKTESKIKRKTAKNKSHKKKHMM